MLNEDHKRRVARLMRGDCRVEDLNRLFADLRHAKPPRPTVQEIGHFAAHRGERDTGISLKRANDIQTSAKLWHRQLEGRPTLDEVRKAGRANFAIMPDHKIRERVGLSRQTAMQSFEKALSKAAANKPLKPRERQVADVFGFSMMWQFAFDDCTLFAELIDLLIAEEALAAEAAAHLEPARNFVVLYALSIMHGTRLKLAEGETALLRLARSDAGLLRIKAEIPIASTPKPVMTVVTLFETSLPAALHCDDDLLATFQGPLPAEIEGSRLVALPPA